MPHTVAPPPINGEAASGRWSPAEPEIAAPKRAASPPGARTSEPALPPAAAARTAAAGPLRVAVALVVALVAVATLATFRLLLSGGERLTFGSASQALLAAGFVAAFVLFLKWSSSEAGALAALGLAALALVVSGLAVAETHRIDMGGAATAGDAAGEGEGGEAAGEREAAATQPGDAEREAPEAGEAEGEAAAATQPGDAEHGAPEAGEAEREAAAATQPGEAERDGAAATQPGDAEREPPAVTPAPGEAEPEGAAPGTGEAGAEALPEHGAAPGEAPEPGSAPADAPDPLAFIRGYYAALDARRFDDAWASLSPAVQKTFGDFGRWRDGYGRTISSTPKDFKVDGSTVTHVLVARDRGCPTRSFGVTWRLERVAEAWIVTALSAKALDDITC